MTMTGLEVTKELRIQHTGGAKHRHLIDYLRRHHTHGAEVSEEDDMVLGYFSDGAVLVAPYGVIKFFPSPQFLIETAESLVTTAELFTDELHRHHPAVKAVGQALSLIKEGLEANKP